MIALRQLSLLPEPDPREWTNDDWATPWEIVRGLEAEFGAFDLDPCCTESTAKAPKFYTKAQDGLGLPWTGRVFCNPPYSEKGLWLRKAYESSLAGAFVVCLVPARTDAAWFHDWILGKAEIRFQRRRVIFRGSDGMEHKTKRPIDGTIFAIYGRTEHKGK